MLNVNILKQKCINLLQRLKNRQGFQFGIEIVCIIKIFSTGKKFTHSFIIYVYVLFVIKFYYYCHEKRVLIID